MDDAVRNHVKQVIAATGLPRQQVRRDAIIHRKQFMGGRMTPDELEASVMPKTAKCIGCGGPPCVTARVFLPLEDVVKLHAETIGQLLVTKPDAFRALCVELQPGQVYVRVSTSYACRFHTRALEKAAAKGPSYAVVDFDYGPEAAARGNRVVVGPTVFDAQ